MNNASFWKKPRPLWLSLSLLVVFAIIAFFIVILASKVSFTEKIEINEKPDLGSLDVAPLAQGKRTYEVITDSSKAFKITQVDIDPLDVKRGETQIVTVVVEDTENSPITKENNVKAIVHQDNTSTPFSFLLKKAEGPATSTVTTWQGSWVCGDSHSFTYTMNVVAERDGDNHSIDLSFR
ncbi:MAG: hypothetical protein WC514_00100 [Candidatus Paceibacterota bacterium]